MNKIAITGGIASGKSEIANYLKSLGYKVYSADDINRILLENSDYIKMLGMTFDRLVEDGRVNKRALLALIINDKSAQEKLNNLAHPIIKNMIAELILTNEVVFVEVPLLVESGMQNMFDQVWLVVADKSKRIERAIARDNHTQATVEGLINLQTDDNARRKIATEVIDNDSDRQSLYSKVDLLLNANNF